MNWIEELQKAKKYIDEGEPELFAFIVRDWKITKQAGLEDLAWALSKEHCHKNDALGLLELLEKFIKEYDPKILLKQYIENFDDFSIRNSDLKDWLDNVWIPKVRKSLEVNS